MTDSKYMKRGLFVVVEGIDKAGKSTQCAAIAAMLSKISMDVIMTGSQPGGTPYADGVLALLKGNRDLDHCTEALMVLSARRDLVEKVIWPNLNLGNPVICDRWNYSTAAYQHEWWPYSGMIHSGITHDLKPDLAFLIDIKPQVALHRRMEESNRDPNDRFDWMSLPEQEKLAGRFRNLFSVSDKIHHIINGDQPPDLVSQDIWNIVRKRIGLEP